MVRFLTSDEVLAVHSLLIQRYGGAEGVRDWGLVESAVNRPKSEFSGLDAYNDIFMKAAVLLFSLIKNHGFVDGNKRVGLACCIIFLWLNGYDLNVTVENAVEIARRSAQGQMSEEDICVWLKKHSTNL